MKNATHEARQKGEPIAHGEEVIHLCGGGPMWWPHTMVIRRDGKLVEVTGRWDGSAWVDIVMEP